MKTLIHRILMTIVGIGLLSCSSSKIHYQSAYKFSHYNYQKPVVNPLPLSENQPIELLASNSPNIDPVALSLPKITFQKVENAEGASDRIHAKSVKGKLTKEEKRAFKKDIRQKVKKVLKERKVLKKEAKNNKSAMNRKVYTGLIIAAGGLVVAILASGTIGGLAIIVGVVLIAWGLIEEGSY